MEKQRMKTAVASLSVASNGILVIIKLTIGLFIGSVSVISEAIHSGVDLVAAVIALFAVRTSSKPADSTHEYGHGKIENIAGTVEALLIFLAAGWIIYESVMKLIHPHDLETVGWGVAVMGISALANLGVSAMLFMVGTKTDSIALKADAMHLRTDVYTSAGVMLGLLLFWFGRRFFPGVNLEWIDPVSAILVALLIIKAAYDLTMESAKDLLDASLPGDEESVVEECAVTLYPRVYGYHHLKTRKSGPYRFFDLHLMVHEMMIVRDAHEAGDQLVAKIKERFPDAKITIHTEPCDHSCKQHCREHCFHLERENHADAGVHDR